MFSPSLLLLLLLSLLPGGAPDLAGDAAALLALRAAVGPSVLQWNTTASPCSWRGVRCSNDRVSELRLPGAGLLGAIPPRTLTNLTALRVLSLRFNGLYGALPSDIGALRNLSSLFLRSNRLSGELPPSLFNLSGIVRLDLAGNNFSGGMSQGFNNFTQIRTLLLENNQLSGEMPEMSFSRLDRFNVSYNNFNGSVPQGLRSQPASSFLGMSMCGGPLTSCPNEISPSPSPSPTPSPSPSPSPPPLTPPSPPFTNGTIGKSSSKLSGGAIAGIAVGSAAGVLLLFALLIFFCNRRGGASRDRPINVAATSAVPKPQPQQQPQPQTLPPAVAAAAAPPAVVARRLVFVGGEGKVFDLEDLLRASAELIGKGTSGTTYKAALEKGGVVAVKRLRDVVVEEEEFRERMEAIGKLDHENVVKLKAYYYSQDEKLLVYEFIPMGSLSSLLHGNKSSSQTPLNWAERSSIALTAARGIGYIHSIGSKASHGNIKSSNILLSKGYEARVSDHGLAQLITPTELNLITGYTAPEVADTLRITQKADVYSFGVLLLELISGKAPSQVVQGDGGADLPMWVQTVAPENWRAEVFDAELLKDQNVEEEVVQLLQLAVECASQYQHQRPSMSDVVSRIEAINESRAGITLKPEQHQDSLDR